VVGEVGGGLHHTPGVARGADAPALARKGDEDLLAYNAKDPKARAPFGTEALAALPGEAKDMTDAEFRTMGVRLSKAAATRWMQPLPRQVPKYS